MTPMSRANFLAAAVASAVLGLAVSQAAAEPVSPWARDGATALRLVDAGPGPAPGARLAAIAITLDPGWKTYWRQPGASGVPPRFDFSGSTNLADAKVVFPVPERSADADGVTNVYHGDVTLPVTVRPRDPSAPVKLKLTADYGVCEAVCVPIHAEAVLELRPGAQGDGVAAEAVKVAVAAAPKAAELGQLGPLSVMAVRRAAEPGALDILVAAPDGAGEPVLFAETGDGDFAPAPEAVGRPEGGRATFRMTFDEPEPPASGLKLTLSAGGRSVETAVSLDEIGARP